MTFAKSFGFLLVLMISSKLARAADDADIIEKGYRTAFRVYEECQQQDIGLSPCLKKKAISFLDRFGRINSNIPITENVELIKNDHVDTQRYSEQDLESLGRAGSFREETLNTILFNKITSLMNGFDLQISLPKMTSTDLKRSIEEGRGKMKKMMGMMMMGMGMKMIAMVPLGMMGLFLLAGKAFIIAKIALVLSLIIALKKLLQQKQGGGGGDMHHGGGWQSSGGGGGGGWDRSMRSLGLDAVVPVPEGFKQTDESFAHSLAYKGQINDSR
ncbi:uncharacterized protein Osi12 [Neodiprion pinetum]|uniref:Uncharacterized protein LOC107228199 n=1 Tax=Neodiprion lecontei TaxID=441921 RepID=A0A6J0CE94_NEOLC|nr:uncharacterized protein LOC107228199 [Neodiprion lecontei]XP_046485255.1 uncharacterized protein LOC124220426 [Neodiprion pinetum]